MSSGLPDYQRPVRPAYGGAIQVYGSVAVPASVTTEIANITGKGMIYGGFIAVLDTTTQKNSTPSLWIDGVHLFGTSLYFLNLLGLGKPRAYPASILKYDDTNFIYAIGISYGLTFETGVVLKFGEAHGTTPTIVHSLIYALM